MPLTDFQIRGYRSIRDVWLKLKPVNIIVGPNGSGKSNLYRAVYLVSCAAAGRFARALAEEGGLESAQWAGKVKKVEMPRSLRLSVRVEKFEYNMECLVAGNVYRPSFFSSDPVVKRETIYRLENGVRSLLLDRRRAGIVARNSKGKQVEYDVKIPDNESVFLELSDPVNFPQLFRLREEFLSWRFYHHFRTDAMSPIRKPQVRVITPPTMLLTWC